MLSENNKSMLILSYKILFLIMKHIVKNSKQARVCCLYPIKWFYVLLGNTNNLKLVICLHTIKWFH